MFVAINFWDPIADATGNIKPELDSGDGIHLNDMGHELLFQKVFEKNIQDLDCNATTSKSSQTVASSNDFKSTLYPNPFEDALYVQYKAPSSGSLQVRGYDITTKKVFEQTFNKLSPDQDKFQIDVKNVNKLQSKVFFVKLIFTAENGEVSREMIKLFRK